jgi:hypothetical protein
MKECCGRKCYFEAACDGGWNVRHSTPVSGTSPPGRGACVAVEQLQGTQGNSCNS